MNTFTGSVGLSLIEWLLCFAALLAIFRAGGGGKYKALWWLLAARVGFGTLMYPLLLCAGRGIEVHLAYKLYFCIYWTGFGSEAILSLWIVNSLFDLAMAPLEGIKDLGKIVFRWAASVSMGLTVAVLFVPHPSGTAYVSQILTELQRAQGVLTLCLLLFVCLALQPLGLSYRSRPFGVILGLAVLSTANLIASGWFAYANQMYTIINELKSIATCVALLLWIAYFVVREPKRTIIVLPTTSPYLHWNQVAQVLGDPPGFVAIAGVPPEIFAPAELEVMRRASLKMTRLKYPLIDHSHTA